jgi:hypothetical protein
MTEAYGRRLGERFRIENAPAIVTRALRTADIAVTETVRCPKSAARFSRKMLFSSAYTSAIFSIANIGRAVKRVPSALFDKSYHSLVFYLPRAALDAIADDANAPRIRDLSYEPGAGVNDVTISGLGSVLLPALSHSDQANRLFVDQLRQGRSGLRHRCREGAGHRFQIEHGRGRVGLPSSPADDAPRVVSHPHPRTVPAVETRSSRRGVSGEVKLAASAQNGNGTGADMRSVLSLAIFAIGVLCFVAFVTNVRPVSITAPPFERAGEPKLLDFQER